ncbi:unnamed protein product [Mycetohabitans rhizoxinica HKI 454]|uniref:Uncharacterized protein n=1 Tax=Mycetohabitans rhizoxinica (strain DSM 19002 / CIP 109453 / HKI 454) TaxID=882378 RepID=E5AL82_MYCRK|nr:unnamed protein product [Mycetohabitans rhizoxinica HKI 454]
MPFGRHPSLSTVQRIATGGREHAAPANAIVKRIVHVSVYSQVHPIEQRREVWNKSRIRQVAIVARMD